MDNKVIVRNKILKGGEFAVKLASLTSEYSYDSLENFRKHRGDRFIMKELFDEIIDQDDLEDSTLYKKYQEILQTKEDNELFSMKYKLRDDLAVSLSAHIVLHHIMDDSFDGGEKILPWVCVDSNIYIADTWWDTDEEILSDFRNLSFVEFMSKHKAY